MTTMEKMNEWSPEESATQEIQDVCNKVKSALEGKLGKNFAEFKAISFIRLFLCGGTHYVIKVYLGQDEYMLVTVNRMIAETSSLNLRGYQLSAPIRPFVSM